MYVLDHCTDSRYTAVYPTGVCAGGQFGGNIVYSVTTTNTTVTLISTNYGDSTCSGPITSIQTSTLSTTCASVSASQPAGQFDVYYKDNGCNKPAYEFGYVDGVCYSSPGNLVQSSLFNSCDANGYPVMSQYSTTDCTGTSHLNTDTALHTCSFAQFVGTLTRKCFPSSAPIATASPSSAPIATASPSSSEVTTTSFTKILLSKPKSLRAVASEV